MLRLSVQVLRSHVQPYDTRAAVNAPRCSRQMQRWMWWALAAVLLGPPLLILRGFAAMLETGKEPKWMVSLGRRFCSSLAQVLIFRAMKISSLKAMLPQSVQQQSLVDSSTSCACGWLWQILPMSLLLSNAREVYNSP
eukprot:4459757-Amphidinium_carterae.1